jgi:hypothetical protein
MFVYRGAHYQDQELAVPQAFRRARGPQQPAGQGLAQRFLTTLLPEGHVTRQDPLDLGAVDVVDEGGMTFIGESQGQGQAYMPGPPDDCDGRTSRRSVPGHWRVF